MAPIDYLLIGIAVLYPAVGIPMYLYDRFKSYHHERKIQS